MKIIPVLDLLDGIVVRGVGGRRQEYRPVESVLTRSARPLEVAQAFREQLGLTTLYVADLDGIIRKQPNVTTLRELCAAGFDVWIDVGLRDVTDAATLVSAGAAKVIAGLESLSGPLVLESLIAEWGASRIVFSLDLQAGRPLSAEGAWLEPSALGIARTAIDVGVSRMIVLDLASVGEQRGPRTLDLCDEIRHADPSCRLITGGGVRGPDDLQALRSRGIDAVLLSTALHNGALSRADIAASTNESDPD